MKQVLIKELLLENFKGVKNWQINFDKRKNVFCGKNATGKTTIIDAWLWLLTGKDNETNKDKEIKPRGKGGEVIHKANPSVSALISINGKETELMREYAEVWSKKRGETEEYLKGHETSCYINGNNVSITQFNNWIDENICPTRTFSILSDPLFFLQKMLQKENWEVQRAILSEFISDDINKDFDNIDFSERKSFYRSQINRLKKQLTETEHYIEERKKVITEYRKAVAGLEATDLTQKKGIFVNSKELLTDELTDIGLNEVKGLQELNDDILNEQYNISENKKQIEALKNDFEAKRINYINKLNEDVRKLKEAKLSIETAHVSKQKALDDLAEKISKSEVEIEKLRKVYKELASGNVSFAEMDTICPIIKKEYEPSCLRIKEEEYTTYVNSELAKRKAENIRQGKSLKDEIEQYEQEQQKLKDEIKTYNKSLESLDTEISITEQKLLKAKENDNFSEEYSFKLKLLENNINTSKEIIEDLNKRKEEVKNVKKSDRADKIKQELSEIDGKIEILNEKLNVFDSIRKAEQRVAELEDTHQNINIEIANHEKELAIIEDNENKYYTIFQKEVNKHFDIVKWELFTKQVNGDVVPACIPTIDGRPFDGATNTAMQFLAGLDVIKTFSKHYDISLPIFIDNEERIDEIPEVDTQLIVLRKVTEYKLLTLNDKQEFIL